MRQAEDRKIASVAVGLLFAALAIVWTFPLITNLTGGVPGVGPGDNLQFLWNFWWVRTALTNHLDVFNTAWLFVPAGAPLTLHTLTLLPAGVAATVLAPLQTATAMNITILTSFALNGLCAYLLAFRLCGDRGGAIVGGLIFGGSSYLSGHLLGHFNLTTAWTVPLFAMAVLEATQGRRVWAAIAGVVLGLTVYTDYYYLILEGALAVVLVATTSRARLLEFDGPGGGVRARLRHALAALMVVDGLVIAAITWTGGFSVEIGGRAISMHSLFNPLQLFWLLLMIWAWMRFGPRLVFDRASPHPRFVRAAAIGVAAFVAVALPVIVSAVRLMASGGYVTQTYFWRSAPAGVDLATLVMGPPFHGFIGGFVSRAYAAFGINAIEGGAWLGVVPVLLALIAFRHRRDSAHVRQWLAVGVFFGIWALGSHAYLLGFNTAMTLPGAFLRYIPIVNNARIPGRAMVMVTLALAMLASVGAARWRSSGRRGSRALAGLVFLWVLESCPAPFPVTELHAPAFYEMLRDRPESGAVLELPVGINDGFGGRGSMSDLPMYFQTIHHRPIVGGYLSRLPKSIGDAYAGDPLLDGLLTLSERNDSVPGRRMPDGRAAAERLRANAVAFVVLDRAEAPAKLVQYVEHVLPLELIATEGERSLYVVRDPEP